MAELVRKTERKDLVTGVSMCLNTKDEDVKWFRNKALKENCTYNALFKYMCRRMRELGEPKEENSLGRRVSMKARPSLFL